MTGWIGMARTAGAAALLLIAAACGGEGDPQMETDSASPGEDTTPAWVSELAEMANAIESAPSAADSVLQAHDMLRSAFDSLLYEVAGDPDLTRAFEALRR